MATETDSQALECETSITLGNLADDHEKLAAIAFGHAETLAKLHGPGESLDEIEQRKIFKLHNGRAIFFRALGAMLWCLALFCFGCASVESEPPPAAEVEAPAPEVAPEGEIFEVRESITVTAMHERFFVRAECPEGSELLEGRCFTGGPGEIALDEIEQRTPNAWACQGLLIGSKAERMTAIAECQEIEQ